MDAHERTFRGGLYRKYSIYLVTAVCTALLVAGLTDIYFTVRTLHAQTIAVQEVQAAAAGAKIGDFMEAIERQATWITTLTQDHDVADLRTEAQFLLRRARPISHIRLLDKRGREQVFVSRFELDHVGSGQDFSGDAAFKAASTGRIHRSAIHFRSESEPYMTIALPRNGGRDGVALFDVNLKPLWQAIRPIRVGRLGYAYAVDRSGTLVAHRNVSLVLRQQNIADRPQVARAIAALAAASPTAAGGDKPSDAGPGTGDDGKPVLGAFIHVPKPDWLVFVEQPTAEANEAVNAAIVRTSALMLGGLLLALGLSLVLAQRMTQPIRALRQGAVRFAGGDLHHRIEIRSRDELQDVADRFNVMADQLSEARTTLERKVEARTQELEVANRAKTRFLAAAGHDLRQPVHAVGLLVSSLRLKLERNDLRDLAAKADLAIDNMRELLDNLLDMSRLEAGTTAPNPRYFPVSRVLEQAEFACASEAESRGLDFRTVRSEQMVLSDPVMLGRIVLNLVANALHNTQSGKVLLGCRRRGRELSIEVWDTGVGIPESRLDDIFLEFFKLQLATPSSGLGLGLYIVRGLADQLGHRLDVSSQVGAGSVFRISVPIADMSGRADIDASKGPPTHLLAGRTILVVDDEPSVLSAMTVVIGGWGCEVLAAASAEEALELFSVHCNAIAIVLCDHALPGNMKGLEVLGRINAMKEHAHLVLVTADTSPLLLQAAEEMGYLTLHKPVQAEKLRTFLTHLLAGLPAEEASA